MTRSLLAAVAVALMMCTGAVPAQNTNSSQTPPARGQAAAPAEAKKPSPGPFHGKLAALDKAAKTIKVGKRTFHITAQTKIHKAGQPARLEDAVVGEPCSGYVKPDATGQWIATTLNLGPKTTTPKAPKKKTPER